MCDQGCPSDICVGGGRELAGSTDQPDAHRIDASETRPRVGVPSALRAPIPVSIFFRIGQSGPTELAHGSGNNPISVSRSEIKELGSCQ